MSLPDLTASLDEVDAASSLPVGELTLRAAAGTDVVEPLHPGLRPSAHSHATIRLGDDPVHGVVLTGLHDGETEAVSALLHLLAGAATSLRTTTLASATGLSVTRVRQIASALSDAGLTQAQPTASVGFSGWHAWSLARLRGGGEQQLQLRRSSTMAERRAGSRIVIDGRGLLTAEIARLAGAAQVGHIRMGWYAGASEDHDPDSPDPCLIISIGSRLPLARARDWWERGIVHLPVLVHAASVDIGPLVVPGQGPCLNCVGLQALTTAAGASPGPGALDLLSDGQSDLVQVEPSLAGLVAGAVTMLALGVIDAHPPPVGVRWHTALPLPSLATSRWEVQPRCDTADHRRLASEPPRSMRQWIWTDEEPGHQDTSAGHRATHERSGR